MGACPGVTPHGLVPGQGCDAVRAYVLITIEAGKGSEIQKALLDAGVCQVDHLAGIYDLVAVIDASDPKQIGEIVIGTIQKTPGVVSTVTLLAIG